MNTFFEKFKYIIILLLFLTIVSISITNYMSTREVIEDKYNQRQELVEKNILQTINHIDDAYKIAERQLNQEMKEYSLLMKDKYRQNPEVMEWDLEELKEKFVDYDIYILNSDLKIIKTTFKKDLGLDFSVFSGFSKVLRERLEGDSFVVDRLDLATSGGEIKKYSYLSTHDNQYLLELSVEVQKRFPTLEKLDIFGDATEITEEYEMVEEISFFSVEPLNHGVAKLRSSIEPYVSPDISETERELARRAVLSNQLERIVIEGSNNSYLYKFFPVLISEKDQQQWNSYVLGIKYNDQIMINEINKHRNLFLINAVIMVISFLLFILIVIYLLNKFEKMAYQDQLTGLANRKSFAEKFNKIMKIADKNGQKIGLLFLDVDKFKEINDNFGHDTGDKILKGIANRLKNSLRKRDLLSRLGGDEFTMAVTEVDSKKEVIKILERIIASFKEPLIVEENKFFISVSIGICMYPTDAKRLEELLIEADHAMYKAKKEGTGYFFIKQVNNE